MKTMLASRLLSATRGFGFGNRSGRSLAPVASFCTTNSAPIPKAVDEPAGNSAQSAASTAASKDATHIDNSKSEDERRWYFLAGFSGFASRKDLLNLLDNRIQAEIDPLLDSNLYPSGRYALRMTLSAVHELQTMIANRHQGKFFLGDESKMKGWNRASKLGIGENSVRTRFLPPKTTKAKLIYLFDKYNLQENAVVQISELHSTCSNSEKNQYILHFKTPLDAERAIIENDGKSFDEDHVIKTSFYWYQA